LKEEGEGVNDFSLSFNLGNQSVEMFNFIDVYKLFLTKAVWVLKKKSAKFF